MLLMLLFHSIIECVLPIILYQLVYYQLYLMGFYAFACSVADYFATDASVTSEAAHITRGSTNSFCQYFALL
jgi:hypothetical protein